MDRTKTIIQFGTDLNQNFIPRFWHYGNCDRGPFNLFFGDDLVLFQLRELESNDKNDE